MTTPTAVIILCIYSVLALAGNHVIVDCKILVNNDDLSKSLSSSETTTKTAYIRDHIFSGQRTKVEGGIEDVHQPYDEEFDYNFLDYYQYGVKSYLSNDWPGCVHSLERAISGYHDFYEATASCRTKCADVVRHVEPFYADDVEDLHFYESMIRRTLCLVKCKRLLMPSIAEFFHMNKWSRDIFTSRKPYTYLQLCYYKTGEIVRAASATYTALLRNTEDTMMNKNLQFYLDRISSETMLEDFDQKKFASFYMDGLRAYTAENYSEVIAHMEKSLPQYTHDLNECRAFCEGEYNQGWLPDFVTSIGNHFTNSLRCKHNCTSELSFIHGRPYDDVFASHYEYLQFAYYKLNKTQEACQAAASFLLIHSDSEEMQANLVFYQQGKLVPCKPRKECVRFYDRHRYELQLLKFISVEFATDVLDAHPTNDIDDLDAINVDKELRQH